MHETYDTGQNKKIPSQKEVSVRVRRKFSGKMLQTGLTRQQG
jgi:hypothetical protein